MFPAKPKMKQKRRIFSVSLFNQQVKNCLEQNFDRVWIEGEISNLACPTSGHWYFSLKDRQAQVRCAMFRTRNRMVKFSPKNGTHVLLMAKVSLYEPRGDFQLLVEQLEPAGEGALQQQFEQLKRQLADEGLFDPETKKPLPKFPGKIGIITSKQGAALKDVLTVLRRRFPAIPVLIYPSSVQGDKAPGELVHAIEQAHSAQHCDVLIVCRGGGSLEDLWAFNNEQVARAMHQCSIPIISAVGHETDVTIADFVADVRAATPSAAAELVSPDKTDWLEAFNTLEKRLIRLVRSGLEQKKQRIEWLSKHIQHPRQKLHTQSQRLDELEQRLLTRFRNLNHSAQIRLENAAARLTQQSPEKKLPQLLWKVNSLEQNLRSTMAHIMDERKQRLSSLSRALDGVSPLATIGRGYAIVRTHPGKEIVRTVENLKSGEQIEAQLREGKIICTIDELQS